MKRQKPNVRFGKPDINLLGYRMSGFRTSESQFPERPDFERPDRRSCLKSGLLCLVIKRSRPKPVPNRFGTGFGLERLKAGQV